VDDDGKALPHGSEDKGKLADAAARLAMAGPSEPTPSTLKMQVAYDEAFAASSRRLATMHARCERRLDDLWLSIRSARPSAATDYDEMQRLHRAVLTYVGIAGRAGTMEGPDAVAPGEAARSGEGRRLGGTGGPRIGASAPGGPSSAGAPVAGGAGEAKEVAAVVESVFPRSALKSFVALEEGEKQAQLQELVRLALGIRLFNWRQGRGTVELVDTPAVAVAAAAEAAEEAERLAEGAEALCEAYGAALASGPDALAGALAASGVEGPGGAGRAARWVRELANRWQLKTLASAVVGDLAVALDQLEALQADADEAVADLVGMVEGQASVPKSVVYPRFHALADAWMGVVAEAEAVKLRVDALAALRPTAAPAACTLSMAAARAARAAGRAPAAGDDAGGAGEAGAESVERLHLEAAPAAMELPLAFQAQCPVLLAGRDLHGADAGRLRAGAGVLVTGDPALGVLRWRGVQVVCSSEAAALAFMRDPAAVFAEATAATRRFPELVRLLQAEASVPDMDLAALIAAASGPPPETSAGEGVEPVNADRLARATMLRPGEGAGRGAGGGAAASASGAAAGRKRDAGTSTPVHFVEKRILPTYTSSEWELRRRALQAANLHGCATHSTQTDRSHFRRDTDTQAFAPRDATVQTGVDAGTNPVHRKTFVVGMRGGAVPVPARPEDDEAVAAAKRAVTARATRTRVKTVTLEYVP